MVFYLLLSALLIATGAIEGAETTPFVIGRIRAQLGNQLFEVAAATSLALDHGAEALFPDFIEPQNSDTELNGTYVFWKVNKQRPSKRIRYHYKEPAFHYISIPYRNNMSISGFFQSKKYFDHNKKAILDLFELHPEVLSYLKNKYTHVINHPKTVAVHVRTYLTDFPNGSDFFTFLGWDYFKRAMKTFPEDSLFIICSDRIDLCKKNLNNSGKQCLFIEGNRHFHDLFLMSLCKHNIISNSSFSWWAAYLNKNPKKIVLAPPVWFGPGNKTHNTKDVIPEEWTIFRD